MVNIMRFEGGPLAGRTFGTTQWPPPARGEMSDDGGHYERESMSALTDEDMKTATHVARGALYRWYQDRCPVVVKRLAYCKRCGWEGHPGDLPAGSHGGGAAAVTVLAKRDTCGGPVVVLDELCGEDVRDGICSAGHGAVTAPSRD